MKNNWQNLGKLSLFFTFSLGLIYRLQFAGIHFSLFDHKNLHQAHTHIGFYGALAGLVMAQKVYSSRFLIAPKSQFLFYSVLLLLSFIGFFWDGYNLITKIVSFFIFLIWLLSSYDDYSKNKNKTSDWDATSFYSLIAALQFLGLIVFHRLFPLGLEIDKLVKGFLLVLLAGHFTPKALDKLKWRAPNSVVWCCLELLAAWSTVIPELQQLTSISLTLLGVLLFWRQDAGFFKLEKQTWPVTLWMLLGLLLLPYNFFYKAHYVAIAGIHFWILGPITASLLHFHSDNNLKFYSLSVLAFACTLSLMEPLFLNYLPWSLQTQHLIAVFLGALMALIILLDFYQTLKKSIHPNKQS